MCDDFIQQFLDDPNTQELMQWLAGAAATHDRSLGESGSTEDALALAKEIYDAGAVKVLAVDIEVYGDDEDEEGLGQNAGRLVIELPNTPADRSRVFDWVATVSESHGFDPYDDTGQTHLFVMLD